MTEPEPINSGGAPAGEASADLPLAHWRQLRWARWLPSLILILLLLMVGGLLSGVAAWLSYLFKPVVIPLLISGALAYLIKPLVDWLDGVTARWVQRERTRHTLNVLAAMAVAVFGLGIILFVIVPSLARQLTQAAQKLPAGYRKVVAVAQPVLEELKHRYPIQYAQVEGHLRERLADPSALIEPLLAGLSATFANAVGVATNLINLLLIPFFVYYILKDGGALERRLLQLVPWRHRATVSGVLVKIDGALGNFVRGQLIVCSAMSVLYAIGFSLLGVPSALSLGFLSGFGHLVPYVGTFLAGLLTCTLALADDPSWVHLALLIGVYVAVQSVESFYLTPFVLGERLDLHPFLVIVGLLVGHHLLGILGVILTVPALAVGKVLTVVAIEYYERSAFYRYGAPSDGDRLPDISTPSTAQEAPAATVTSAP
ncbi:MAG: AI-2E family transporter [Chloracidobacterium sp.]|nr:AI-2E family transporter [Chloracidobacterium sp.]MDW8216578.1 AI-2E family transporter [Acidobacteriota bacterium]